MAELSTRIISEMRQPLNFDGFSCRCGVSIGIAQATGTRIDGRKMLVNADIALYRAKNQGRNRYEFFTQNLQSEIITLKRTPTSSDSPGRAAIRNLVSAAILRAHHAADRRGSPGSLAPSASRYSDTGCLLGDSRRSECDRHTGPDRA